MFNTTDRKSFVALLLCLLLAMLLPASALCEATSYFPAEYKLYETCPASGIPSPTYEFITGEEGTVEVLITVPEALALDASSFGTYQLAAGAATNVPDKTAEGESGSIRVLYPADAAVTFIAPAITSADPALTMELGVFPESQEVIFSITKNDDGASVSLDCKGNTVFMWQENGFPICVTYDAEGALVDYMGVRADERFYMIIGYYPKGQLGNGDPYLTCVVSIAETGDTLIYRSDSGWMSQQDPEATDVQPPEWFDAAWLEAPQTYPN